MAGTGASLIDAALTSGVGELIMRPCCSVCGEQIKKHKCVHYGAITCYSCRAFFRRTCIEKRAEESGAATTTDDDGKYECKSGGHCNVTGGDRRKCRSCRFDRCLAAGMKPEQVLSQEEKAVRFKKYYEKKKKDAKTAPKGRQEVKPDLINGSRLKEVDTKPRLRIGTEPKVRISTKQERKHESRNGTTQKEEPAELFGELTYEDIEEVLSNVVNDKSNYDQNNIITTIKTEAPDDIESYTGELRTVGLGSSTTPTKEPIRPATSRTMPRPLVIKKSPPSSPERQQMNLNNSEHAPSTFYQSPPSTPTGKNTTTINYHMFSRAAMLAAMQHPGAAQTLMNSPAKVSCFAGKPFFKHAIRLILAQFEGYLALLPQFQALPEQDRVTLQARNAKLFLMYIIGRVFSSGTSQEQMQWIFGEEDAVACCRSDLEFIPFHSFATTFSSPHQQANVNQLLDLAFDLKLTSPLPPGSKHLVAMMFSFYMTDVKDFSQPEDISNYRWEVENHLHLHHYPSFAKSTQGEMLNIVTTMISTFDTFFSWNIYHDDSLCGYEMAMPFTTEERLFLERQLSMFNEAFKSVPMGENLCREFLMFSYGMSPSPAFMMMSHNVFMERFKRVFQLHPEFTRLSAAEQTHVWMMNGAKASLLYMLALEACPSGAQQLEKSFGTLDISHFNSQIAGAAQIGAGLGLLSITDLMPTAPLHIIHTYKTTAHRLNLFFAGGGVNLQPLMVLLYLFSNTSIPEINGIRSKYLLMLEREAAAPWSSSPSVAAAASVTGNPSVRSIMAELDEVDKLSIMMRSLQVGPPTIAAQLPTAS